MKTGDTAAVFHRTFGALPEVHFLHSIYHFKLRKSRIQRFKPCTIWSWNEEDMAFGRQLHQAEGQFRTVRNWNSNVRNVKLDSSCVVVVKPACEVDFSTCELRFQRAKIGYFCRLFFFWYFLCLNFHFLLVFNYSCNSLARKYPRKGKITFLYKFSCKHWKKHSRELSTFTSGLFT